MDNPPTSLYRTNPPGDVGIWACEDHKLDVAQLVKELAHVLEKLSTPAAEMEKTHVST